MFRPKSISRSKAKGVVCRAAATKAAASRCRQGVCRVGLGDQAAASRGALQGRGFVVCGLRDQAAASRKGQP